MLHALDLAKDQAHVKVQQRVSQNLWLQLAAYHGRKMNRQNLLEIHVFATCNIRFSDRDSSACDTGSFAHTKELR